MGSQWNCHPMQLVNLKEISFIRIVSKELHYLFQVSQWNLIYLQHSGQTPRNSLINSVFSDVPTDRMCIGICEIRAENKQMESHSHSPRTATSLKSTGSNITDLLILSQKTLHEGAFGQ